MWIISDNKSKWIEDERLLQKVRKNLDSRKVKYEVSDNLNNYLNTPFDNEEEAIQFNDYKSKVFETTKRDIGMDVVDYDIVGWWKENRGKPQTESHKTDKYKKPTHITFSTESKYSTKNNPGGRWEENKFYATEANIRNAGGVDKLKQYFAEYEPDTELVLPQEKATGTNNQPDTLKYSDIVNSQKYKELDIAGKEKVASKYFGDFIAPTINAPEKDKDKVMRKSWDSFLKQNDPELYSTRKKARSFTRRIDNSLWSATMRTVGGLTLTTPEMIAESAVMPMNMVSSVNKFILDNIGKVIGEGLLRDLIGDYDESFKPLSYKSVVGEKVATSSKETQKAIIDKANKDSVSAQTGYNEIEQKSKTKGEKWSDYWLQVTEQLPVQAMAVAAVAVTKNPQIASAIMGMSAAADEYQNIPEGYSEEYKLARSAFVGIAESAIEDLTTSKFLGDLFNELPDVAIDAIKRSTRRQLLGEGAKIVRNEVIGEMLTTQIQSIPAVQAGEMTIEQYNDAVVMTGLTTIPYGLLGGTTQTLRYNQIKNNIKAIDDAKLEPKDKATVVDRVATLATAEAESIIKQTQGLKDIVVEDENGGLRSINKHPLKQTAEMLQQVMGLVNEKQFDKAKELITTATEAIDGIPQEYKQDFDNILKVARTLYETGIEIESLGGTIDEETATPVEPEPIIDYKGEEVELGVKDKALAIINDGKANLSELAKSASQQMAFNSEAGTAFENDIATEKERISIEVATLYQQEIDAQINKLSSATTEDIDKLTDEADKLGQLVSEKNDILEKNGLDVNAKPIVIPETQKEDFKSGTFVPEVKEVPVVNKEESPAKPLTDLDKVLADNEGLTADDIILTKTGKLFGTEQYLKQQATRLVKSGELKAGEYYIAKRENKFYIVKQAPSITKSENIDTFAEVGKKLEPEKIVEAKQNKEAGNIETIKTPTTEQKLQVQYDVIEADDIITSHNQSSNQRADYPQGLQVRTDMKEREGTKRQIASRPDFNQLNSNYSTSEGAPIINGANVAESGNLKTLALSESYDLKAANEYKQNMIDNAEKFGLDPKKIGGMKKPILVRRRLTPLSNSKLLQYVDDSNNSSVNQMSQPVGARKDAIKLGQVLPLLKNYNDLLAEENIDFLQKAYNTIIPATERAIYLNNGDYTLDFKERLQDALMVLAYGDGIMDFMRANSVEGSGFKRLQSALSKVAPLVAKYKDMANRSVITKEMDISIDIADAINIFMAAKQNNEKVSTYTSPTMDVFGEPFSQTAKILATLVESEKGSDIAKLIEQYYAEIEDYEGAEQASLFSKKIVPKESALLGMIDTELINKNELLLQIYDEVTNNEIRKQNTEEINNREVQQAVPARDSGTETEQVQGTPETAKPAEKQVTPTIPIFESYEDALEYIDMKAKEYKGRDKYLSSPEYKEIEQQIQKLYEEANVKYRARASKAMSEANVKVGDRVTKSVANPFHQIFTYTGNIVLTKQGKPMVKLETKSIDGKSRVAWDKGFTKITTKENTDEKAVQQETAKAETNKTAKENAEGKGKEVTKPKIVKVEWKSKLEEVPDTIEGVRVARRSDWNSSEVSEISGRDIVHVFWISEDGGKTTKPYGIKSAGKMLGLSESALNNRLSKAKAEFEAKERKVKNWKTEANKTKGKNTLAEAMLSWSSPEFNEKYRNKDGMFLTSLNKDFVLAKKDGKLVAIKKEQIERIEGYKQAGWDIEEIDPYASRGAMPEENLNEFSKEWEKKAKDKFGSTDLFNALGEKYKNITKEDIDNLHKSYYVASAYNDYSKKTYYKIVDKRLPIGMYEGYEKAGWTLKDIKDVLKDDIYNVSEKQYEQAKNKIMEISPKIKEYKLGDNTPEFQSLYDEMLSSSDIIRNYEIKKIANGEITHKDRWSANKVTQPLKKGDAVAITDQSLADIAERQFYTASLRNSPKQSIIVLDVDKNKDGSFKIKYIKSNSLQDTPSTINSSQIELFQRTKYSQAEQDYLNDLYTPEDELENEGYTNESIKIDNEIQTNKQTETEKRVALNEKETQILIDRVLPTGEAVNLEKVFKPITQPKAKQTSVSDPKTSPSSSTEAQKTIKRISEIAKKGNDSRLKYFAYTTIKTGFIDIRNTPITTPQALAEVLHVFRNPFFETHRIIYIKDGKILSINNITSNIPGKALLSKISNKKNIGMGEYLKNQLAKNNADYFVFSHNHPSGDPTASVSDLRLMEKYSALYGNKFRGQIITNGKSVSIIPPNMNPKTNFSDFSNNSIFTRKRSYKTLTKNDMKLFIKDTENNIQPESYNPSPNNAYSLSEMKINSPIALCDLSKQIFTNSKDFVSMAFANSQLYVNAVEEIPVSLIKSETFNQYLKKKMIEYGAVTNFAVLSEDIDIKTYNLIKQLYKEDIIEDGYIYGKKNIALSTKYNKYKDATDILADDGTRTIVMETPAKYETARKDIETIFKNAQNNNLPINELYELMIEKYGNDIEPYLDKYLSESLNEIQYKLDTTKQSETSEIEKEATKHDNYDDFVATIFNAKSDYAMSHRPSWEGMPPLDNLLEGDMIPKDVYDHPEWSIAGGHPKGDKSVAESLKQINKYRGKPDATVTVYRASPSKELHIGDWITLSKEYAKGESLQEGTPVHEYKVKASDVIFAGDDINEFGYYPYSLLSEVWENKRLKSATSEIEKVRQQYQNTDKWMKAPNGKDTKLNERQWLQVRTDSFKKWFGDWENDPANASKVVDENGEPMVVYHGTKNNFTEFDITKTKGYSDSNYDLAGFYFAGNIEESAYGKIRMRTFLNLRNPYLFDIFSADVKNINYSDMKSKILKDGYDSVIYTDNNIDTESEYIAFSPTQIKSATANEGTFNPNNPDIRYSANNYTPEQVAFTKRVSNFLTNLPVKKRLLKTLSETQNIPIYQLDIKPIAFNKHQRAAFVLSKLMTGNAPIFVATNYKVSGLYDSVKNQMYINVNSKTMPQVSIAGHEAMHHIQNYDPALYKRMQNDFLEQIKGKEEEIAKAYREAGYNEKVIMDEAFNDYVAEQVQTKEFWDTLHKSSPDIMMGVIKRMAKVVSSYTSPYFDISNKIADKTAAFNSITTGISEYLSRQNDPKFAEAFVRNQIKNNHIQNLADIRKQLFDKGLYEENHLNNSLKNHLNIGSMSDIHTVPKSKIIDYTLYLQSKLDGGMSETIRSKTNEIRKARIDILNSVREFAKIKSEYMYKKIKYAKFDPKDTIKALRDYIAKHDLESYSTFEVKQILNKLKETPTMKHLEDAFDLIDRLAEKKNRTTLLTGIKEMLALTPNKDKGYPVGKMPQATYDVINKINAIMDLDSDQVQEKSAEIADALNEIDRSNGDALDRYSELLEEKAIYDMFGNIKSKTVSEIAKAYTYLSDTVRSGTNEVNTEIKIRKAVLNAKINIIEQRINGKYQSMSEYNRKKQRDEMDKNIIRKAYKQARVLLTDIYKLEAVLEFIAESSTPSDNFFNGFTTRATVDAVRKGMKHQHVSREEFNKLNAGIMEIMGSTNDVNLNKALEMERFKKEQKLGIFFGDSDITKEGDELIASQAQLGYLYAMSLSEGNKVNLEAAGYDDRVMGEIMKKLDPRMKKIMDLFINHLSETWGDLNEVYKRINFVDMGKILNYFPRVTQAEIDSSINPNSILGNPIPNNIGGSVKNSSVLIRTKTNSPIKVMDAFDMMVNYVEVKNKYIYQAEALHDMNSILRSAKVKNAIRDIDVSIWNNVETLLDNITIGASKQARELKGMGKAIDKVTTNVVKAAIKFKIGIGIKQLASTAAFAQGIGHRELAEGLAQAGIFDFEKKTIVKDPRTFWRNMQYIYHAIPQLMERYRADTSILEEGAGFSTNNRLNPYNLSNFSPVQWAEFMKHGDMGAILTGGVGYTMVRYNEYLSKGNTPDVSMQNAIEDMEREYVKHQQDPTQLGKSIIQGQRGIWRWFTVFKTSQNQYFTLASLAIKKAIDGGMPLNDAVRVIFNMKVLMPLAFGILSVPGMLKDKYSVWKMLQRLFLLGFTEGISFIDVISESALSIFADKDLGIYGSSFSPIDSANKRLKVINKAIKEPSGTNVVEAIANGAYLLDEMKFGIGAENIMTGVTRPIKGAKGMINGDDDLLINMGRLFNYSDYPLRSIEEQKLQKKIEAKYGK